MESDSIKLKAIFMATLFFNLLFWQEKMGLNVLLFDLLIGASIFFLQPKIWKEKTVLFTGAGTLLLAFLIIWNNSLFTKVIHLLSALSFLGFVQVRQMEFIGTAFGVGFTNIVESPLKAVVALGVFATDLSQKETSIRPVWRWAQLSVVPLILVGIFYGLYALANPAFANLSGRAWNKVLPWIMPDIDVNRTLFFLFGLAITSGLLWPTHLCAKFREKIKAKVLSRKRKPNSIFKFMDLKMEYRSALVLMVSLNLLLFFVNAIDFWYVWLGNGTTEVKLLSNYVHEGTWLLIVAILLGMVVLGYYFRRNLNFYPGNNLLKIAAFSWIVQNGILALSVGMRNFRYIEHYGLAHKRLGVILFLSLVIIGLLTMLIKVKERKTFYYLLFQNAWACYFALILACSFNWDVLITKYNLSGYSKAEIDTSYLVDELSDKNLYVLLDHYNYGDAELNLDYGLGLRLKNKRKNFINEQERYSWLSWNYSDFRNWHFLKETE